MCVRDLRPVTLTTISNFVYCESQISVPYYYSPPAMAVRHLQAFRFTRDRLRPRHFATHLSHLRWRNRSRLPASEILVHGITQRRVANTQEKSSRPNSKVGSQRSIYRKSHTSVSFFYDRYKREAESRRPKYALHWFPARFKIIRSFPAERETPALHGLRPPLRPAALALYIDKLGQLM